MPQDRFEVQAVCADGSAAIDRLGFYLLRETPLPAPGGPLPSGDRSAQRREEEFWISRICCYMRLSLELERHQRTVGDCEGRIVEEQAALEQAQWRVYRQMQHRMYRFGGLQHESLRRFLWGFLTGSLQRSESVVRAHHAMYVGLTSSPPDEETVEAISRDLSRTFPTHCLFVGAGSVGQEELRRVLSAYSRFDPAVGYCQGMAFIVALLLLHAPEEEAFGMLLHLSYSPAFQMREVFLPGLPRLRLFLAVLRRLIERLLPALHRRFVEIGLDVFFFAPQWFLTLYTYQFPLDFVCRLWDLFFVDGWRVMFQAAIATLHWEQEQLLSLDMEAALLWIKECHEGKSAEEMVRRTRNVPLSEAEFRSVLRAEEDAAAARVGFGE
ncbi:rab6 GTPase activating protein [Trypanosoma rangeli]|uniref:Rab6 GTPase activating protein n=1 Tax=Trypanosoma rangeli TaxID=5698 RepID=A0A3R7MIU7_TRYRA|nr:rab6 GTPase activating protein [Trypanosoma rangeli]RNF06722.1 rab6 GTPase activating protein [Trypanosoma rangeli]|eukprot:RNF06722.1 rab6 GTPase activating protein [Trypanosoma rangeli]